MDKKEVKKEERDESSLSEAIKEITEELDEEKPNYCRIVVYVILMLIGTAVPILSSLLVVFGDKK